MKQRIVTAAVGLTIFFAVLALYHTVFLNISVAVIIFLALYEMFHVTGVWENKVLSTVCLLFGYEKKRGNYGRRSERIRKGYSGSDRQIL